MFLQAQIFCFSHFPSCLWQFWAVFIFICRRNLQKILNPFLPKGFWTLNFCFFLSNIKFSFFEWFFFFFWELGYFCRSRGDSFLRRPVLVMNSLGIVNTLEAMFAAAFVLLLIWSLGNYLYVSFGHLHMHKVGEKM